MKKLKSWYKRIPSSLIIGVPLILIVAVAAFLRFYQIGKLSFWNDEIDTAIFISPHSLQAMFQRLWPKEINMALYYLLVHYWVRLLPNTSEGALRSISALFSIAGIPVIFFIGRIMGADRKKGTAIGLVAALLVTLNAFHIQYAQEFRSYSLLLLLSTLSTLLLIEAVKKRKSLLLWITYTLVSVAAVYCHYFVVFLLIAQVISLLILFLEDTHSFPFKGIIGSGVAIAILSIPLAVATFLAGTGGLSWVTEPTLSSVKNFVVELTGNHGELLFALYVITGSIGLLAERVWLQKDLIKTWIFTLIASCLFLPVLLLFVFSKLITPIFAYRYLLFTLPYLAIFVAVGIVALIAQGWRSLKSIGIVAFSLIIVLSAMGVKSYFESFQKEDWRGVSQFLTDKCSTNLRLYYMTYRETNAVYYNSELKSQSRWWIDQLLKNPSSEKIIKSMPDGYKQVCLVLANEITPLNTEQIKIIQSAILTKFPKVTKVKFPQIDIEIYER